VYPPSEKILAGSAFPLKKDGAVIVCGYKGFFQRSLPLKNLRKPAFKRIGLTIQKIENYLIA